MRRTVPEVIQHQAIAWAIIIVVGFFLPWIIWPMHPEYTPGLFNGPLEIWTAILKDMGVMR